MIRPEDVVRLPAGVRLTERGLEDDVRGAVYPLNASARLVLEHAGLTIGEIAARVAREHGEAEEQVVADLVRFCATQNARLLLEVEPRGRLLPRALALAARGLVPAWPRRRCRLRDAAAPLARAAAVAATPVALVTLLLVQRPADAFALGAAVALGVVVHEAGHALVLRGHPACLAVAGLRLTILHRPVPPPRRCAVAAAGPAAAVALGVAVLGVGWGTVAGEAALAGSALTAHALALTVAAADGRAACGLS